MKSDYEFDAEGGGTGVLVPKRERRRECDTGGGFPPIDWDDFGGGGGGGGDDDSDGSGGPGDEPDERRDPFAATRAADLGLSLGLVAISSLFLIFFAATVFLARNAEEWPPADAPRAPLLLLTATAALILSSACLARASAVARRARRGLALRWLGATLACGTLFLVLQVLVWSKLHGAGLLPSTNGYGALFYTLTGLHGLHVFGGLVYLASVFGRLWYGSSACPDAVRLCGVYWHFMGLLWVALFCVLYVPA